MVLRQRHLKEILKTYPHVEQYMNRMAIEKKKYHASLVESIAETFMSSSRDAAKAIEIRLKHAAVTKYISLKRKKAMQKENGVND
jgi:hypothetical protein